MTMNEQDNRQYQHIILVSLDSLRNDCLTAILSRFPDSVVGRGKFNTTLLNYLIAHGTYFSNCITAAPYTSASHAAYFTGCWPRHNGVYEFFNRQIGRPTIFELAHQKDIHTIFQTDFPIILGDSLGFTRGVDKYFIESEKVAFSELLRNRHNRTVSFFHFGGIHYPYGFHKLKFARADFPQKVRELEQKFNVGRTSKHPDMLDESFRDSKDKDLLLRYKSIVDSLWVRGMYHELHRLYIEGIDYFLKHRFNSFIKRVINFVDSTNSLLIVFADHGESWSADSRGHSNAINDAVLRVPLIFYGKGVAKGAVVSKLVRTIDVLPTICRYSSINCQNVDGMPINLATPNASIGSREAFAQVWRVGNRLKIYRHQQRILKGKKMIKPLATKLEKEAVYHDNFALNREYLADGKLGHETLFKNTGRGLRSVKGDAVASIRLRNLLKRYNRTKYDESRKINEISKSIADDLQTLGYHV